MLHLSFLALNDFFTKHQRLPGINDIEDAKKMTECSKFIFSHGKNRKRDWALNLGDNLDERFVLYLSYWCQLSPVPICSFLGGIVSQEIIKHTGKFTPFNQWYYFDFFYLLKKDFKISEDSKPSNEDLQNKYLDNIAIFGKEIQQKLSDLNLLVIGCGALGTEFLKIFSVMGLSTNKGTITVTDNDVIETSNLNRQLLFKKENIGGFKSKIAKDMIKQINPSVNCIDKQIKIEENSEEILPNKFFTDQDIIFTCVDNLETRKYFDQRNIFLKKIHIDTGTIGTKGHSQIMVPNKTTNFNDMEDFDTEYNNILHNFPSQIEDCIEWGKFKFTEYFNENFKIINTLMDNLDNFPEEISQVKNFCKENELLLLEKIIFINKLVAKILKENNNNNKINLVEEFVIFAIEEFSLIFNINIQKLLIKHPYDDLNKDGSRFWIGAKRLPMAVIPNKSDQNHLTFFASFCNLISSALKKFELKSLEKFDDKNYVKQIAAKILSEKIDLFEKDKIEINYKNLKKINDIDKDLLIQEEGKLFTNLKSLKDFYMEKEKEKNKKRKNSFDEKKNSEYFLPIEFEKDKDFNQHINFIMSCSNIRAQNYKIKETDFIKTKLTAGKIIPGIASTTALVTGFASVQLYSLCDNIDNSCIKNIKNAFVNLSIGCIIFTESFPNKYYDNEEKKILSKKYENFSYVPNRFSNWDYLEVDEDVSTFKELKDFFKEKYLIIIKTLMKNKKIIFDYNIDNDNNNNDNEK